MSIRHAVLALLADGPLHGYAIHAALEERLAELLEPAYGDVYRALAALERRGLVASAEERVGRRPRRRVYTITADGLAELRGWLVAAPGPAARLRDDLPLRVLLAYGCAPELAERVVAVHAEDARGELAELLQQRSADVRDGGLPMLLRAVRVESAVRRARARLETVELCGVILGRLRRGVAADVLAREVAGDAEGRSRARRPTG